MYNWQVPCSLSCGFVRQILQLRHVKSWCRELVSLTHRGGSKRWGPVSCEAFIPLELDNPETLSKVSEELQRFKSANIFDMLYFVLSSFKLWQFVVLSILCLEFQGIQTLSHLESWSQRRQDRVQPAGFWEQSWQIFAGSAMIVSCSAQVLVFWPFWAIQHRRSSEDPRRV